MNTELPSGAARFSGSVPEHYEEWLGPLFFEPYAVEIASRIEPALVKNALEIACGTGRVTRQLLKKILPDAKLIASDISPDMLDIARRKSPGENIEWKIINAEDLPFDNDSMDLIVCAFGYMFVPDRLKAFKEAHRVLRTSGKLIFTTWDHIEFNGASNVYRKTVKKYIGNDLPASYKLPFSMHDDSEIRDLLSASRFINIVIERSQKNSVSETAAKAATGLTQGGSIYNEIMAKNPKWIPLIRSEVKKELEEKYGAAPMIAPMQALIITATK